MVANLVDNVHDAIKWFAVVNVFGWLDSTVSLHWIQGGGHLKQFVGNRERKIEKD